jgi:hypothetical protein
MGRSSSPTTDTLSVRLGARRAEIERAIVGRVSAISDPPDADDPEYIAGLRAAIVAGVDYAIAALDERDDKASPIPTVLLSQARLAARNNVGLDTVIRRYLVSYTLLGDFVLDEAERGGTSDVPPLKRLLRSQAALFDRVVAAVSEEYSREEKLRPQSSAQRHTDRVRRLLAGELVDTFGFGYEFVGWHLGVMIVGSSAEEILRDLATSLGRLLLLVEGEDDVLWAWLGGRSRLDPQAVLEVLSSRHGVEATVATGEPAGGLFGWRLTHKQAKAALHIALGGNERFVRYADIALVSSMRQDELLCASLQDLYVTPLKKERDGGRVALETLRAYYASARNVSSAAALLGVSRKTVGSRLRMIEARLGRTLDSCAVELEAVLRLEALEPPPSARP